MVSILPALRQVKADLPRLLTQHVHDALDQLPAFHWRDRLLNPLVTLNLFIMQIMHGNTAITHLRHLAPLRFSATAYCKARMRLPLALVQHVSSAITRDLRDDPDAAIPRWRGHRIWRADGTGVSMPDTPALQKRFGQPGQQKPGCGFPVATLLVLCDAAGFIVKTLAMPLRTHEASQLAHLHDEMEPGDVLIYDRAGCSYAHLALISRHKLHLIVRMHQRQLVDFRRGRKHAGQYPKHLRRGLPRSQWIKSLGKHDQLVQWFKPAQKPAWMDARTWAALPDSLMLRELRVSASRRGFRSKSVTLVSTLIDAEAYPAKELAEQYLGRWQIEVNLRDLKRTLGMDVLKCKTVDGVLKELAVFVLVYNLVRLAMVRAAARQGVAVDRISFIDALRWLCAARDRHGLMKLLVNPHRPDRVEPRVVKRRAKSYPLMNRPRAELRKMLMSQGLAA